MSFSEPLATRVRTTLGFVVIPTAIALHSAVAIVLALLGVPATRIHWVYISFARLCTRFAGTRLQVRGADAIRPDQGYVIVSNHTSSWDVPCIVAGLPALVVRFVAKEAIMRIPLFGHAMRLTGNVMVMRSKSAEDVERIRKQMDQRDSNTSLLFFAEGTRSSDGSLESFRRGAFSTAIGYGLPILPIALAGPFSMWPKGNLKLRPTDVAIEVGKPISVEGLEFDDRIALCEQAHEEVARLRMRARQRLRDQGCDPGGVD